MNLPVKRLLISSLFVATSASAAPTTYTDEATYLQAITDLGLAYVQEGFESDAVWGSYRSTLTFSTATSVTNLGVTWTSNYAAGSITTGDLVARTGNWGFFAYPHGSYDNPPAGADCANPEECGDGFIGTAVVGTFKAVGGWFSTNTPGAQVGLYLGGYPGTPLDFGSSSLLQGPPAFFGVIDTDGFSQFEFRERQGTAGDLQQFFADDFSIVAVPEPASIWIVGASLAALLAGRVRRVA